MAAEFARRSAGPTTLAISECRTSAGWNSVIAGPVQLLHARFIVVTGDSVSGAVRTFVDETGLSSLEKAFSPDEVRPARRCDGRGCRAGTRAGRAVR
jgi:hypothetical protein